MTLPDFFSVGSARYRQAHFRLAWDDEILDYGYKCRTQSPGFVGPDNPPAVLRFYPEMRENSGDYRVNLSIPVDWQQTIIAMNGGDARKFFYLVDPSRAQFNTTGWPKMAYLGMSGNELRGERIGEWFCFDTLTPADADRARNWTIQSHPQFVHRFTCVTWDAASKTTRHILSTGTPRGDVFYPLTTREGYAFIPWRYVVSS